jgi:hypothetical protein
VADDVLRMELGCRPYASWMDQRKLEFAFRLATMMAADSLPARVASACWPRLARKGLPVLHAGVVIALERAVDLDVAPLAAAGNPEGCYQLESSLESGRGYSAHSGCARHAAPGEIYSCSPLGCQQCSAIPPSTPTTSSSILLAAF